MNWSKLRLIVLIALILAAVILHKNANAVELTDVSIQYQKFFDNNYSPYLNGPQNEKLTLLVNTDLLPAVFWNNKIIGITDDTQYRHIGWNFQLGLRVTPIFSVQYEHFSQHALDRVTPLGGHFPVEDSLGLTLHLMSVPNKLNTVFPFN
jgi:hypothetical protein